MAEDLQKKIQDFNMKQKMLFGGQIEIELTLEDDGKVYITNVKNSERLKNQPEWVSGYLFNGKEFATLEELCDYYGITEDGLKVLISNNGDLKKIEEIINNIKYAKIDMNEALNYMITNPELTDEQIIQYFNPYCYYNIRGDFVIVPLPEGYKPID